MDNQPDKNITLITGDVKSFNSDKKFDVACICGVGDFLGGIGANLSTLEKFIKPYGKLVMADCFLNRTPAPQELIDFDGKLHTLAELYKIFSAKGLHISFISTGANADRERYISWNTQRTLEKIPTVC